MSDLVSIESVQKLSTLTDEDLLAKAIELSLRSVNNMDDEDLEEEKQVNTPQGTQDEVVHNGEEAIVVIDNHLDDDTLRYPLPLLRGSLTLSHRTFLPTDGGETPNPRTEQGISSAYALEVEVSSATSSSSVSGSGWGSNTLWPVCRVGHTFVFKAFVHLFTGKNKIRFRLVAKTSSSSGVEIATDLPWSLPFSLSFKLQTNPRIVRFRYVMTSDDDGNGSFDAPIPQSSDSPSLAAAAAAAAAFPSLAATPTPVPAPLPTARITVDSISPPPPLFPPPPSPLQCNNHIDGATARLRVAALLLQSLSADLLHGHDYGQHTFNLEYVAIPSSSDLPSSSTSTPTSGNHEDGQLLVPRVYIHRCRHLTTAQAHTMNGGALHNYLSKELVDVRVADAKEWAGKNTWKHGIPLVDEDDRQTEDQEGAYNGSKGEREGGSLDVVIMSFTRFDALRKTALAHTALGGIPLALFGSGCLHTWPASLSDIWGCFTDTRTMPFYLFDDSAQRKFMWANASTTLGATLHELGHSFSLHHVPRRFSSPHPHPIMHRGFDHLHRVILPCPPPGDPLYSNSRPNEPKEARFRDGRNYVPARMVDGVDASPPLLIRRVDEMCWNPHNAARLRFHRFFCLDERKFLDDDILITVSDDHLVVRARRGIVDIGLCSPNGDTLEHCTMTNTHSSTLLPSMYAIPLETFRTSELYERFPMIGVIAVDGEGNFTKNSRVSLQVRKNGGARKRQAVEASTLSDRGIDATTASTVDADIWLKHKQVIQLRHTLSGQFLYSLKAKYTHVQSSQSQMVVCIDNAADEGTRWEVSKSTRTELDRENLHQPICHGDTVTLRHVVTDQCLSSCYQYVSPITSQQEVSCFTSHDDNANDFELIVPDPNEREDPVGQGTTVHFRHVLTNKYLHSHQGFSNQTTGGYQEATAWHDSLDVNNDFRVKLYEIM
eukprot:TRINITY_DN1363_c1_g1_i1.p1 TRINITY_DN1363_c1_g1~~TRINITY_DN1363_c1_g1_i1.p1  ORF type:complete len:941 (+),score=128.76 TRINITY_DN1363_c1_g1_i1:1176-3998(+)